jgi:titin
MEDRTLLSAFLVTNTGDSGPGSLRHAILDSNAATGGTNTIDFEIPGPGVQVIAPASPLPAITRSVLIDGRSQPGFAGTPLIELDGSQAGTADGLTITGPDVTVRGLDIGGFGQGAGIHITGAGATRDWIYGDFLGTDPSGTQAQANDYGVEIDGGAAKNLIGTNGDGVNDTVERNVISGNQFAGIWINGQGTDGNAVAGNFIGTSVTGDLALANASYYQVDAEGDLLHADVVISGAASGNRIGTNGMGVDDAGERNLMSGSHGDGVDIAGSGTDENIVAGNFIGTNVTGDVALGMGNTYNGVSIAGAASSNRIGLNPNGGGMVGDEGNVISGNGFDGVYIRGSDGNVVAGNKIGTDVTGTVALGNYYFGVQFWEAAGNTVGGTTAGARNLVSGNLDGVAISGIESVGDVVQGNLIGTDVTGTEALGNANSGVYIGDFGNSGDAATKATIGGTAVGAGNVISANGNWGVEISDNGATGTLVQGNRIGTDITGTIALGNAYSGVQIDGGASNNTIGGSRPVLAISFPLTGTTASS